MLFWKYCLVEPFTMKAESKERATVPSPKRQRTKSQTSTSGHSASKSRDYKNKLDKQHKVPPPVPHAPPPQPPPPAPAAQKSTRIPEVPTENPEYGTAYQQQQPYQSGDSYSTFNPYVSQNMYSSSFMSQEGSQSINSLITPPPQTASSYPQKAATQAHYSKAVPQGQYSQQTVYTPPPQHYQAGTQHAQQHHSQHGHVGYPQSTPPPPTHPAQSQYQQMGYSQHQYPAAAPSYPKPTATVTGPSRPNYQQQQQTYRPPPPAPGQASTSYPYKSKHAPLQQGHTPTRPPAVRTGLLPTPANQIPPGHAGAQVNNSSLAPVRITGRR